MERILDLSILKGRLICEDENYASDFSKESGYLFSIAVPSGYRQCRIFAKENYKKSIIPFTGKYYITLTQNTGEMHSTNNYNEHINHNIIRYDELLDYIDTNYQGTLEINFNKMVAILKDQEHHLAAILKEETQELLWYTQHTQSMKNSWSQQL